MNWDQYLGEKTADYINKWRNTAWSDPRSLNAREQDEVKLCLSMAAYQQNRTSATFITAYDKAVLKQMKAPSGRILEQLYVEPHMDQVLGFLRKERSPFLALFPEVNKVRRLGWPMLRMFKEGGDRTFVSVPRSGSINVTKRSLCSPGG